MSPARSRTAATPSRPEATPSPGAAEPPPGPPPGPREWRVLAVVLAASVMTVFDLFVVNIAMPDIRRDLHAGPAAVELVVSGYAFAYAAGLITGGRLGDRYGYRRMFVIGLLGFTIASLLCALARSADGLVTARILQGLAAAILVPQVLSLITVTFGPAHRGRATAWYGAVTGIAGLAGQIGGGLLVGANLAGLGWRVVFLVNLPIGCAAVVLALRILPTATATATAATATTAGTTTVGAGRGRTVRLDPLGAMAVTGVMTLILVPLAFGPGQGWAYWTWSCPAIAVPAGVLLLRWQARVARRGDEPIIDTRLFANRSYVAMVAACGLFQLYFGSFMFSLSLLLQVGLGRSPVAAAALFLCQGALFTATSLWGGRFGARRRWLPVVGVALVVVGLGALVLVLSAPRVAVVGPAGTVELIGALGAIGAGNGFLLPPLLGAALSRVRLESAGAASGMLATAQQFATSFGVTVFGLVFFAVAGAGVGAGVPHFARAMQTVAAIDAALVLAILPLVRLGRSRRPGPT